VQTAAKYRVSIFLKRLFEVFPSKPANTSD
jgi:hypothetical protein